VLTKPLFNYATQLAEKSAITLPGEISNLAGMTRTTEQQYQMLAGTYSTHAPRNMSDLV